MIDYQRLFEALFPGDIQVRRLIRKEDGTKVSLKDAVDQALSRLDPELAETIRLQFNETPLLAQALLRLRSPSSELRQFCVIHA
jgi:hypothetical protein